MGVASLDLEIALVAAEATPYAKVGGLADVAGALPPELERLGARVQLVVPAYRSIERERFDLRRVDLPGVPTVPVGGRREPWRLETGHLPGSTVDVLLVGGRYFDRDGVYTDARTGRDFDDQLERWVFFCRAALAALRFRGRRLDLLHLNDHHTATRGSSARRPSPPRGCRRGSWSRSGRWSSGVR
jgi:starch synthase